MMGPGATMCSFQSESCKSNDSELYFGETSGVSNQDLNYQCVDTESMKLYSGLVLTGSTNSSIKNRNNLSQLKMESCDIDGDDYTFSEHFVSSICMLSESSNSYATSSYLHPSEQLSHESSLRFIGKSSTDCSESDKQDSRLEKQKEKLISNDAGKGYQHMDQRSSRRLGQNKGRNFSFTLANDIFNINRSSESIKSALQLSSHLTDDPIQHFHARHYAKLSQYMMFVHNHLPIPIAITVENSRGSTVSAYIFKKNSDTHMRNTLHFLGADSLKFNPNKKSSKPLQKISSNLILHFACQKHCSQCLYPGPLQNKCFSVKTKYYVFWMQLLVLEVQFHHTKPVHITHSSMCLLRNMWNELTNESLHNLSCHGSDLNPLKTYGDSPHNTNNNATSGPEPIHGSPLRQPETLIGKELYTESKIRAWNSLKVKSKKKRKRQSSFFFIATHSYPTTKHLDKLLKELKEIGYFELFQMKKTKMPKAYTEKVQWDCFVCGSSDEVWKDHSAGTVCMTGINGRKKHETSVQGNVFNLDYELNPLNPRLTGTLKIKHIKTIPRALAWITSWQVREFKLEDGFIAWKYFETKHNISWPKLPIFKAGCKKSNQQSSYGDVSSLKTRTKKNWSYLSVDEILHVKGNYQKGTPHLDHLEIETCDHGTWLVKPHLNEYCSDLLKSNTVNSTRDGLISDYLDLWLRGLQIAMVRSSQK
ncbi:unnamed protein product [Schistosoma mattheei]|nr:unnamed protein product [Schistosoma mattheei]